MKSDAKSKKVSEVATGRSAGRFVELTEARDPTGPGDVVCATTPSRHGHQCHVKSQQLSSKLDSQTPRPQHEGFSALF